VDIRLIAATNEDLEAEATAGRFRQDLFFRLNTVTLRLPPLRDRPEDIPLLVEFFAERFARRHGKPVKAFAPEVVEAFRRYRWRGNVRELEHLIEMLTLMVDEDVVRPGDLPGAFREAGSAAGGEEAGGDLRAAVARFEKGMLQRAIEAAGGVKARAARGLGLDPNQMKYLCRKYGL
jgi:DNA-binding NtrC family response regulator